MLSPSDLGEVLKALSSELAQGVFQGAGTASQVCARCLSAAGLRVRQRDVTFLIRGMQLNGHLFGQGHDGIDTLRSRLVDQMLFLCAREQMIIDEAAVAAIRRWIVGVGATAEKAAEA